MQEILAKIFIEGEDLRPKINIEKIKVMTIAGKKITRKKKIGPYMNSNKWTNLNI